MQRTLVDGVRNPADEDATPFGSVAPSFGAQMKDARGSPGWSEPRVTAREEEGDANQSDVQSTKYPHGRSAGGTGSPHLTASAWEYINTPLS